MVAGLALVGGTVVAFAAVAYVTVLVEAAGADSVAAGPRASTSVCRPRVVPGLSRASAAFECWLATRR